MSRRRAFVLATVSLLMIAHYVQWVVMGTTVSPIEPSETMYTLASGAVNAGFIFFALALLATLIFGRFVCGWGCHIVALQDASGWLLRKIGLKPRPFRSRLLILVPLIAALYMFVWPTVARYLAKSPEQPLWPQFTNHVVTTDFWATFPSFWVAVPFLFVCGFLTVYFLGNKGFCTYACPYGGFFALVDRVSPGRIRVTDACNECGECTAVCTSNVVVHREVKQFGTVVDPGCMKCMDCVAACPNDALYFGFGKPAILTGAAKQTTNAPSTTRYLSWPLEIAAAVVFAATFFATWDVYQLVPMLMALGIAAVVTFLVIRSFKLVRAQDLSFYKWVLRSQGRMQVAGWAFLSVAFLTIAAVGHSGWIRYQEMVGSAAFSRVQVPDELALAQANPVDWLSTNDRSAIAAGRPKLDAARRYGAFTNLDNLPKLAWLEFLSGDADRSIETFSDAASRQSGRPRALSLFYRGSILNRLGRYEEALSSLDSAAQESSELIAASEEAGVAHWHLGHRDEAVKAWKVAAAGNAVLAKYMLSGALGDDSYAAEANLYAPNDPYYHWMIGLRLADLDMKQPAETHFQRAVQLDPKFILRRKPK